MLIDTFLYQCFRLHSYASFELFVLCHDCFFLTNLTMLYWYTFLIVKSFQVHCHHLSNRIQSKTTVVGTWCGVQVEVINFQNTSWSRFDNVESLFYIRCYGDIYFHMHFCCCYNLIIVSKSKITLSNDKSKVLILFLTSAVHVF